MRTKEKGENVKPVQKGKLVLKGPNELVLQDQSTSKELDNGLTKAIQKSRGRKWKLQACGLHSKTKLINGPLTMKRSTCDSLSPKLGYKQVKFNSSLKVDNSQIHVNSAPARLTLVPKQTDNIAMED